MTTNTLPAEVNAAIVKAKADGHQVFSITISGVKYVYRSINRTEFRTLQDQLTTEAEKAKLESDKAKKALPADSPELEALNIRLEKEALAIRDRGEEKLVLQGLLHPAIGPNTPAGVFPSIANRIMASSGFDNENEPEML